MGDYTLVQGIEKANGAGGASGALGTQIWPPRAMTSAGVKTKRAV
jgi:hypothetical protein